MVSNCLALGSIVFGAFSFFSILFIKIIPTKKKGYCNFN